MDDTSVVLELAPSDYTKEMWDNEFLCTFTVTLEADQLKTSLVVDNKGEEAFDFQAALHSYFTVSALENLEISGSFEGKEFLNKLAGDGGEMQTEDRSIITIGEEYDRVYTGVNDPVLNDKGTGKSVRTANRSTDCIFSIGCTLLDCVWHSLDVTSTSYRLRTSHTACCSQHCRMGGYRHLEPLWQ